MKKAFVKYPAEITLLIYLLLFFSIKKPYHDWDRTINSDGKAYYAYLTALFIYHDWDFRYVEMYEDQYYPLDKSAFKELRQEFRGETVNIGFPGLAVLWLPFFLLAHVLTIISGLPPDGYSILYQYAIGIATLFYLWLGLKFLQKLLHRFEQNEARVSLAVFLTGLATNIVYYAIVEPSMAHIYSFALLNGFFLFSLKAMTDKRPRQYALAAIFFSLAAITRPTNGLFIFVLLFLAGGWTNFIQALRALINNYKALVLVMLAVFIVFLIPPLLWYVQTGYFFVYSYGDAEFDFSSPHLFSILFSYHKGWFVYTPVAFVSIAGFVPLYRENRFRSLILLAVLFVHIYIASCWWNWHYASKFSQRVFIDFYGLVALLLVYTFRIKFSGKPLFSRKAFPGILLMLLALNLFQFYQQRKWVFPATYITKETYLDSFLRLKPIARVDIPAMYVKEEFTVVNDLKKDTEWKYDLSLPVNDSIGTIRLDTLRPYSIEYTNTIPGSFTDGIPVVIAGADVLSDIPRSGAVMVVEVGTPKFYYSYNPFYIGHYNKKGTWTRVEFALRLPETLTEQDLLKVYIYNGSNTEKLWIDNIWIKFLTLDDTHTLPDGISKPFSSIDHIETTGLDDESEGIPGNMAFEGLKTWVCDQANRFCATFRDTVSKRITTQDAYVIIESHIYTDSEIRESRQVIEYLAGDSSIRYEPVFFGSNIKIKEWSTLTCISDIPETESDLQVRTYFWNPTETESFLVDKVEIKYVSLKAK